MKKHLLEEKNKWIVAANNDVIANTNGSRTNNDHAELPIHSETPVLAADSTHIADNGE